MTMRERLLAVIRGDAHDRVPFAQYSGIAAPDDEVWSTLGRDSMGIIRWSSVHRIEHPNCRIAVEPLMRNGRRGERRHMQTPAGTLTEEKWIEPVYGSAACHKHYVVERADWRVLAAYLRDVVIVEDLDPYLRDDKATGDDGLPMVAVMRTPWQQLWVQWVNLGDLAGALAEWPEETRDCMDLLADIERRVFRAVRSAADQVPIPYVDFPDNITAPTIGPDKFREWCVPLYDELAGMLAEKDVPVFVHMDGDLRRLSADIAASKVGGLDSFSPQPDNDTSVAEAVCAWPEKRLFINFPSSVHIADRATIRAEAERILTEGGHTGRLEIQISENVPPHVWRRSFPEIVGAINDFGRP